MTDRVLHIFQIVFRLFATIALIPLVLLWLEEFGYLNTSTVLLSSRTRTAILYWTTGISISLPFLIGVEWWLIRKIKPKSSRFWLDLALTIACFTLLVGLIFYSLGQFGMFR
jgi:hypothetical protein